MSDQEKKRFLQVNSSFTKNNLWQNNFKYLNKLVETNFNGYIYNNNSLIFFWLKILLQFEIL
jgi:hypothetical protein